MAISRFDQPGQLDLSVQHFMPQQFIPNFEAFDEVLGQMQAEYDASQIASAKMPLHMASDRDLIKGYGQDIQQKQEEVANAFMQDVSLGRRKQAELMRQVAKDWMPGGKYAQVESNFAAHQAYKEQLNNLYEKGQISSTKRDVLLRKSEQGFSGSFTPEGTPQSFSGISAAADVNLAEQAEKLSKGWMADQVNKGVYTILNGDYYEKATQKKVDYNEVFTSVYNQLIADPKNFAFAQQEAFIRDLAGEDSTKYVETLFSNAADFGARKAAFSQMEYKQFRNWQEEERVKQRNRYDIQDYLRAPKPGELETRLFTIDAGMPELGVAGDGKVQTGTRRLGVTEGVLYFFGKEGRPIYKDVPIDEFINDPKNANTFPGLKEIVDLFPRERFGDNVESNAQYNKKIIGLYNQKRDALTKARGVVQNYSEDERKNRKATVIGTGEALGDIVHKTVWVRAPGAPPQQMTVEDFIGLSGAADVKEFIARTNIIGKIRVDNPIAPAGEDAVYSDGSKTFSFTISNTSANEEAYNSAAYTAMKPLYDGSMIESPEFTATVPEGIDAQGNIIYGQEKMTTRAVDQWDQETGQYLGRKLHVIDENGNNLTVQSSVGDPSLPVIDGEYLLKLFEDVNPNVQTRTKKKR